MKIKIYAPNFHKAAKLAATMNLSLRHWDWAGDDGLGKWANVGEVMDHLGELEFRIEGLEK